MSQERPEESGRGRVVQGVRSVALLGVGIVLILSTLMACAARQVSTSATTSAAPAPAGTLIDWQHLGRVPVPGRPTVQADVYRFSYVTRSDHREIATARMAIPAGGFDASYDLVAHLHGTIGFADHCAPSMMPGFGFESPVNPIPADMVAAGRVVVMPDYPGLGAPGVHRYVQRDATGRSVWDGLAAARTLVPTVQPTAETTNRVLLTGHSQGGHATFAALATRRPGDDFDVVGAVAFAPPGDAIQHARLVADGQARAAPFAWALMSYAQAYPDAIDPAWWFEEEVAQKLPGMLEERCAPKITVWLGNDPEEIFTDQALHAFRSGDLPPGLEDVMERERLDGVRTDTEILVYHGTRDGLLPAELSRELARRLEENGTDVEWRAVEGGRHLTVPRQSRREAVAWIERRFH